ncbi:MAG: 3-oxoacyl-ACP reductase [Rhodobacterales bacterium]|nr:MAG: 3-oxoacyl-ACP reductase [Pseudomonadota bacterium]PIE10650.1 MAG: 3-oxoacyl-ACP reductase [Rhodobacterales bacterium]
MTVDFKGRVAIVTGAGVGLGRSHALGLAERGARVVVNDLGAARDGTGSSDAAMDVVKEIRAAGGHAIANGANVADADQVQNMVDEAIAEFGHVDILINNAGILRDKTFAKMSLEDFKTVVDVHLMGSVNCTHALWRHMLEREYGRIVLTSSSSGLYGNFGQANYGAAKSAMLGLMNVLHHEGSRKNVRTNVLAPTAVTRMTEELFPPETHALLGPETITPGVLALVAEDAPSKMMLGAGGGSFAEIKVYETPGITLDGDDLTADNVAAQMARIRDPQGQTEMSGAFAQTQKYMQAIAAIRGIDLNKKDEPHA